MCQLWAAVGNLACCSEVDISGVRYLNVDFGQPEGTVQAILQLTWQVLGTEVLTLGSCREPRMLF